MTTEPIARRPLSDLLAPAFSEKLRHRGFSIEQPFVRLTRLQQQLVLGLIANEACSLREAMPLLVHHQTVSLHHEGVRHDTVTSLERGGVANLGHLARLPMEEIRALMTGPRSERQLAETIHFALRVSARNVHSGEAAQWADDDASSGRADPVLDPRLHLQGLPVADLVGLELIAAWGAAVALRGPAGSAAATALAAGLVPEADGVAAAIAEFAGAAPAALLETPLAIDFADRPRSILRSVIADLCAHRAGAIYVRRTFFIGRCPTLDVLGHEHGVSRERIRQLEQVGAERLAARIESPEALPLRWRIAAIATRIGPICPVTTLDSDDGYAAVVATNDEGAITRQMVLHLLKMKEQSGWLGQEGGFFPDARAALALADDEGFIGSREDLEERLIANGVPAEYVDEWVAACGRLGLADDTYVTWPRNVVDRARLMLRVREQPMDLEELTALVGPGMNRRAVRDPLLRNLTRTRKNEVALPAWGLASYEGVAAAIEQMVDERGGRASLASLMGQLPEQFGISAVSVSAFARAPYFVVKDSWVRIRGEDEPYMPMYRAYDHPRVLGGASAASLAFVIVCDEKVLAGFSPLVPEGFAFDLTVTPGTHLPLSGAYGDRALTWNSMSSTGPLLSSVRVDAMEYGLAVGDALVAEVCPEKRLISTWGVRAPTLAASDRKRAAFELMGCNPEHDPTQAARRLWINDPLGVTNWVERVALRCPLDGWFA